MLDGIKTYADSIQIATGVLSTLATNPEKMKAALDPFMLATDLADYLVRKGVPFRDTHHISGQCVAFSEKTGTPMNKMKIADFKGIDARFEEDVLACFDYEKSVEMRSASGGTSKKSVLEQIAELKKTLA
jgi:argininosuccinate lyase